MESKVVWRRVMGSHLILDVEEAGPVIASEDDEDDICIVVAERSEPIEIFLSGCVPQCELDEFG